MVRFNDVIEGGDSDQDIYLFGETTLLMDKVELILFKSMIYRQILT